MKRTPKIDFDPIAYAASWEQIQEVERFTLLGKEWTIRVTNLHLLHRHEDGEWEQFEYMADGDERDLLIHSPGDETALAALVARAVLEIIELERAA